MIVGWNDNYSKDNFASNKPSYDGAWLVKNSYANSGYFWLSYQEGSLKHPNNNGAVITGIQKSTKNEHMLSYDYFMPEYNNTYYFRNDVYLCNVFDISDYISTYNQINKVMFYLATTGCTYDIKIIQLDSNGSLPTNFDNYTSLSQGTYKGEGYVTANLNIPFNITTNNKCAILVKLLPITSMSKIYLPYEGGFKINNDSTIINPEISNGESYFASIDDEDNICWNDCKSNSTYGIDGRKGNLIIRPVLCKSTYSSENINISPNVISNTGNDVSLQIDSDITLFNIHTKSNYVLRENINYIRTTTGIKLKKEYINSLNGVFTELVLEFNNDITKTIIINPKSDIEDVLVTGNTVLGKTLTATCIGVPEKNDYDVAYQWQSSFNGNDWYDISNATKNTYTITNNDVNRYIRVKVTSLIYGNVVYPLEKFSSKSQNKVIILGDVDLDGDITISDCTLLQYYCAGMTTLTKEQLLAADINEDGSVNITDITEIQKLLNSK